MKRLTALATAATMTWTLHAGVAPTPAGAATRTVTLVGGNAPAAIDLVGARVRSADDGLRFVLWVRDLGSSGRFEFHWDRPLGEGFHEQSWVAVRRTNEGVQTVIEWSDGRDAETIRCPNGVTRWQQGRDRVLIVIPRRCDAAPHGAADFDAESRGLGGRDRMPTLTVVRG